MVASTANFDGADHLIGYDQPAKCLAIIVALSAVKRKL